MIMRIGNGFDVHALVEGRPLVIGGVTIPHPRGLAGHSDADVLLHAISDAMLGALALGDLGAHFPDTDPRWKGADSRALLRHVVALVAARGYGDRQRRRDRDRAGAEARAARCRRCARTSPPTWAATIGQRVGQGDDDRAARFHGTRRGHCGAAAVVLLGDGGEPVSASQQ